MTRPKCNCSYYFGNNNCKVHSLHFDRFGSNNNADLLYGEKCSEKPDKCFKKISVHNGVRLENNFPNLSTFPNIFQIYYRLEIFFLQYRK